MVNLFEKNFPQALREGFVDRLIDYRSQREFRDFTLSRTESAILNLAKEHLVIQKEPGKQDEFFMPDRKAAEYQLKNIDSYPDKQANALLEIYGKIFRFFIQ